mmetsp:Transcript_17862/g.29865  ORF Transcript_17862/g.29865 Transcript_17862/m.29865 type:complete len:422 (+) Transcript_17862:554-1819(+)
MYAGILLERFIKWLQAAFPLAHVVHKSLALGSTDSTFAMSRFRDALEKNRTIDLALFDSSMNDRWAYHDSGNNADILLTFTEKILRLANHHGIAVAFLSVYMGPCQIVDELYDRVCAYYGVPMLSYRSVVIDQVRQGFATTSHYEPSLHINGSRLPFLYYAASVEEPHPKFQTHVIIAQMVCDYFEKAYYFYTQMSQRSNLEELLRRVENKASIQPAFGGDDDDSDEDWSVASVHSTCHPTQTFFSSLSSDKQFITNELSSASANQGWSYMVDYPGKPEGWVSDGLGNNTYGTLLFPVLSVNGKVTISYLKSYRNMGKFIVFLIPRNFKSGNMIPSKPQRLRAHPHLIGCCKGNRKQTLSALVDTFDNSSNTSVIISRTLHFDFSGSAKVVVQRVPVILRDEDEEKVRGNCKVKIVSIRSC